MQMHTRIVLPSPATESCLCQSYIKQEGISSKGRLSDGRLSVGDLFRRGSCQGDTVALVRDRGDCSAFFCNTAVII